MIYMVNTSTFPTLLVTNQEGLFGNVEVEGTNMEIPVVVKSGDEQLPDKFTVDVESTTEGTPMATIRDASTDVQVAQGIISPYLQLIPPGAGLGIGPVMLEGDFLPQLLLALGIGSPFAQILPPGIAGPGGIVIEADAMPQLPIIPALGTA